MGVDRGWGAEFSVGGVQCTAPIAVTTLYCCCRGLIDYSSRSLLIHINGLQRDYQTVRGDSAVATLGV